MAGGGNRSGMDGSGRRLLPVFRKKNLEYGKQGDCGSAVDLSPDVSLRCRDAGDRSRFLAGNAIGRPGSSYRTGLQNPEARHPFSGPIAKVGQQFPSEWKLKLGPTECGGRSPFVHGEPQHRRAVGSVQSSDLASSWVLLDLRGRCKTGAGGFRGGGRGSGDASG